MNERIGQLAEQSGLLGPSSRIGDAHEATERFAELILKECLKYIDDSFGDIDYVKFMIKRNFGVSE
jgi:hypothetical protein